MNLFCVITANFESTETCSTSTGVDNEPNIAESDFSPAVVEFCVFLLEFESLHRFSSDVCPCTV